MSFLQNFLKRIFDIFFALLGLVLMLPVVIAVKIAYLLSGDNAGIFYSQKRVGKGGREFIILKFRSMSNDADSILQELLKEEKYRKEWEEKQKFTDDPRITRVGRALRETSLDELPQIINVLKGDMSFVGPRPLVPGELEKHNGLPLYQEVKPGITGWWACNGRNNIDYPERLDFEYYYVKNRSFCLDMLCIFKTIRAVISREGAQ